MPATTFIGDDRFELLRRVGRGGMGEVYEARDTQRDARVAVKVLQHVDPSGIYRFKREFRSLADIAHPNLVSIYELLSFGEKWYLTMELVDGVDILSYVRGTGEVSRADTAELGNPLSGPVGPVPEVLARPATRPHELDRLRGALLQLAGGLAALHAAGMVHRDVKPSNVLVTPSGRVVLLDFGLVGQVTPTVRDPEDSDLIVGTVAYIAPEQLGSATVTPAADWYSVGVILYQALTGRAPFAGDALSIMSEKETVEPPPPRVLVDGVPEDLDRLCEQLLRRDPAARPIEAEILAVLGAAPARGRAGPAPGELVGRERHLRALHDAFAKSRAGACVTAWLRGESGMGKTALAHRFLAQLRAETDALVVEGRCYERESVPYKAFDSLVDDLSLALLALPPEELAAVLPENALALAHLFPVLRRIEAVADASVTETVPDPVELRRRAVGALRELVTRLAARHPVVLYIDDLQWGDADSAHIIAELTRPPDAPGVLLLGCVADVDPHDRMAASVRDVLLRSAGGEVRELVVGALQPSDAQRLAASLLDDAVAAEQADVLAWESGGSPLFIHELAAYLNGGAAIARSEGAPQPSITLEEVLRARFDALPDGARRALEVVAAAGTPLELGHLRTAAELGDRTGAAVSQLRAAHLIRGRGTRKQDVVETYHGRIRAAALEGMDEQALADRHRRLAVALERDPRPDPERLARHWRLAGVPDKAAQYACAAAERAATALAFDRAAHLFTLCLDTDALEPSDAQEVREQLADALANAGRGQQAAEAYLAAAEGAASKTAATELRRRAAEQLLRSGFVQQGVEVVRDVLSAVGIRMAGSPRSALVSALAKRARLRLRGYRFRARDPSEIGQERLMAVDATWSAATGLAMVETIHSVDIHARGTLLALSVGDRYRVCRALVGEGLILSAAGGRRNARATNVIRRAEELAAEIQSPMARGLASMAATYNAFLAGRYADCVARAKPTIGQFRNHCVGAWWELTSVRHIMIWSLFYLGRFAELPRRVLPALREAESRGDLYAATMSSTGLLNAAWLTTDDVDQARERLEHAREWWSTSGYTLQHYNQLLGDVQLDLYTGATRTAYDRCVEQWRALERSLLLRTQQVRLEALCMRARAALAAGELGDADQQARRIAREGMPWATPLAGLVRAAVAHRRDDADAALAGLEGLADAFDAVDFAAHAAVARRRRGELLGGDAGAELVAGADDQLRDAGLANPAAWSEMIAPGFAQ